MDKGLSDIDLQALQLFLQKDKLRKYIEDTRDMIEKLELLESYLYGEDEMTNEMMKKAVYELFTEQEERRSWKLKN